MKCVISRFLLIAACATLFALSVTSAHRVVSASETLVLTNVMVIDGNGGRPMPNMTVVISDQRIADMFATGKKRLPAGATVMKPKTLCTALHSSAVSPRCVTWRATPLPYRN